MRFATILAVLLMLILAACRTVTREEIDVTLWLTNAPLTAEMCAQPNGKKYGFYRRLDTGKLEFISFCKAEIKNYVAIRKNDLERLLSKAGVQSQRQLYPEPSEPDYQAGEDTAP